MWIADRFFVCVFFKSLFLFIIFCLVTLFQGLLHIACTRYMVLYGLCTPTAPLWCQKWGPSPRGGRAGLERFNAKTRADFRFNRTLLMEKDFCSAHRFHHFSPPTVQYRRLLYAAFKAQPSPAESVDLVKEGEPTDGPVYVKVEKSFWFPGLQYCRLVFNHNCTSLTALVQPVGCDGKLHAPHA